MNKNILIFVGSNNKSSICNNFAKDLSEYFTKYGFKIEVLYLHDLNINYCIGCRNCFNKGFCIFKESDDVHIIDQKILNNEVILFISSVYVHNVPGKLKSVFDRLAYKFHLLEYAGKLGFTITNTFGTGSKEVKHYLEKTQINFGIYNLINFEFINTIHDYKISIREIKNSIFKYLDNDINIFDNKLEEIFLIYKNSFAYENVEILKKINDLAKNELTFWTNPNIQKINSFKEFEKRKKTNNFSFKEDEEYLNEIELLVNKL